MSVLFHWSGKRSRKSQKMVWSNSVIRWDWPQFPFLQGRRGMTDEEWVDLHSSEDEIYFIGLQRA